jgi:DNA repair protein RadC
MENKICEDIAVYGTNGISDRELLVAAFGTMAANGLLEKFSCLRDMVNARVGEIASIKGIGRTKAARIKAMLEICRRVESMPFAKNEVLASSKAVFEHFHALLCNELKEYFYCVLLDAKHRIIKKELISIGSLNISIVHPREVFACAIKESANSILLLHNHPSGDPFPSQEDIYVTKRLIKVGKVVGIEIIDHIIIGHGTYYSFLENGNLGE